jgi:hypothetical protein
VTVKAPKDFSKPIGEAVGVAFDEAAVHLFDQSSGNRIN